MNIILIRHGETPLNRARILQPADTPLSDLGQQQAKAMAQRLKEEPIDAILSSDMTRAAQTAQALSDATDIPIAFSTLLHERSFGDLRGQRFDDLGFDPMAPSYAPPNGETWEQFYQRVAEAFELVIQTANAQNKTLAVVSHGLVIREIVNRHLSSQGQAPERLENTSVTIFEKQPPHTVSVLGSADHIQGLSDSQTTNGGLV